MAFNISAFVRQRRGTGFAAILVVGCALMALSGQAMAIEEPAYRVIEAEGAFELREYQPYLLAETRVEAGFMSAGNVAFGRLFGYISGNNVSQSKIAMTAPVVQRSGEKIAMTAPVQQSAEGEAFRIGFVVPAQYTLENVPQPTDPRVSIREVSGGLIAVWRYSGRWTEANFKENELELRQQLQRRGLRVAGQAQLARYNSPFKPWFLRRNEVQLAVSRAGE